MDKSLDTIKNNLVNFFADLVAFFQMVFNYFMDMLDGLPKAATGSDAEGETEVE